MDNPFQILSGKLNIIDRNLLSLTEELIPSLQKSIQERLDPSQSQKYGNAKDAAKRYGVHHNTVRNWAKQGFIKKRIVEGVSLYSFEEIDAFIDSKAV